MKNTFLYFLCTSIILSSACSSSKNSKNKTIAGYTWELEYLKDSKVAFEELYPDKKPQISFNAETKTVSGNDGCNGYSAPYTLKGNSLYFGEPGPSTLMYCGEGSSAFRETIKKINSYKIKEDKLVLLTDDVEVMRFYKIKQ